MSEENKSAKKESATSYKETMNLPSTSFKMKASLSQKEPLRLEKWDKANLYEQVLKQREGCQPFILHDGPPYANGPIHIGHAFNKILKDFIVKYKSMRGFYAPYVPGWDCHGLPIENKVENELGKEKMAKIPVATFRKICREYAEKQLEIQRKGFKRLGVLGEWDNPYLTFLPEYEVGNIRVFKKLFLDGAIYQGRKPIHWCSHCHTALAEAEIEYSDETSPSIYVKFALKEANENLGKALSEAGINSSTVSILIWTTTPWTLPANMAVSLAPLAQYIIANVNGENIILAKELLEHVAQECDWQGYSLQRINGETTSDIACEDLIEFKGKDLLNTSYVHPILDDKSGTVIYGEHVTLDTGCGCVHTAPGHGVDDYLVSQQFGIETVMPVDDDGKFMKDTCPWAGKDAVESNQEIIEFLRKRGTLAAQKDILHSYPHCWRCKEPVIFRATTQWFVSMDKTNLRKNAVNAIENEVEWIPAWTQNRIEPMVSDRPDWCISRQRFWGVPLPIFECKDCGTTIANEATFDAVIDLFAHEGADAWYQKDPSEFLPADTCCPECGSKNYKSCTDVLDVWFESGVSHTSVCGTREYLQSPADVYLEGSDQHRGWFQSSLLTSVAAFDRPPYKAVISCGFTMDKDGKKMSKSLGNVIDPADVIAKSGADVLRLWVASVDYSQDVSIGDEIIDRTSEAYRRIRNTFRYLLSNLYDFSNDDFVSADEMLTFDKWAMSALIEVANQCTQAYDEYKFYVVFRTWYDFISKFSSIYLDAIKDRLYSDAKNSVSRRSAQSVLANMLECLVRQLAPILSFTCDEVWEYYPEGLKQENRPEFVALAGWPLAQDFMPQITLDEQTKLIDDFILVENLRDLITKELEQMRDAGEVSKSQEVVVNISVNSNQIKILESIGLENLAEIYIVSKVNLTATDTNELSVELVKAQGDKCPRCWNYRLLNEDGLCARCSEVVSNI
ncbi:MAG: isoleucine--tRNA ligase [Coriobacteriales bacterium]|nr:isoleucine--tRNA ligase [Coriobacteriales bacterium]